MYITMDAEKLYEKIKEEWNYKKFTYKWYECRIIRHSKGIDFFWLCWYVQLTEKDKYYWENYDTIPYKVHWWLTYWDFSLNSYPEEGFWIGFDCQHCWDLFTAYMFDKNYEQVYRDMEYVENELKKLVDQIVKDKK